MLPIASAQRRPAAPCSQAPTQAERKGSSPWASKPAIVPASTSPVPAVANAAVATGKTRGELQKVLQTTHTEALFDITRSADETASKPSPQMLHEILSHFCCPSERALMVGDSIYDLDMARNANMASVAVTCGAHPKEELQHYQPLLCLQQPAELLTFINRG